MPGDRDLPMNTGPAALYRWWTGELAGLIPGRLRPASGGRRARVLVEMDATEMRVSRLGDGGEEIARLPRSKTATGAGNAALSRLLRSVAAGKTRLLLRVPAGQLLQREVRLPAAAAENLADVLGFEMHRLTPFAAADVHFEYRLLERRDARGELHVLLTVVRRSLLDEVLTLLAPTALGPVGLAEAENGVDGVLLELAPPPADRRAGRLLNRLVWSVNGALLVALLLQPLARQDEALAVLRAEVARARDEAQAVVAIRERLETLEQRRARLIAARHDRPSAAELLRELTDILPDGTWARQVDIERSRITLLGSSESASALIGTIEDSPLFQRASFASPVTRDPVSGREQFRLAFETEATGSPP